MWYVIDTVVVDDRDDVRGVLDERRESPLGAPAVQVGGELIGLERERCLVAQREHALDGFEAQRSAAEDAEGGHDAVPDEHRYDDPGTRLDRKAEREPDPEGLSAELDRPPRLEVRGQRLRQLRNACRGPRVGTEETGGRGRRSVGDHPGGDVRWSHGLLGDAGDRQTGDVKDRLAVVGTEEPGGGAAERPLPAHRERAGGGSVAEEPHQSPGPGEDEQEADDRRDDVDENVNPGPGEGLQTEHHRGDDRRRCQRDQPAPGQRQVAHGGPLGHRAHGRMQRRQPP